MEQHKHCRICQKPVPLDEDFCSEECKDEYDDLLSSRKKKQYVVYGLLIVLFIVMILTIY